MATHSCGARARVSTRCSISSTRRSVASTEKGVSSSIVWTIERAKDEELRQTALLLAERARTSRETQEIGPLNPYARRIVHLAIADDPGVSSESIGDAFLKTVLISAGTPVRRS